MIYTTGLGFRVREIAWYDHASQRVGCTCRYPDGTEKFLDTHVSRLTADGGIAEILGAAIEHRHRITGI